MLVEALYLISIALFGCVVLGAAQLPNGILLVISLFPVFLALILGCMMWLVAAQVFGLPISIGTLLVPVGAAIAMRRLSDRNLSIAVWSIAAVGMLFAYFAISLADFG
jgi:hypothetical protein